MDAPYIILLAFGAQAAALAVLMTVWLVRIGMMPAPRGLLPALGAVCPPRPGWEPAAPRAAVTVLSGLEGLVVVASNQSRNPRRTSR
jgi:hypothetical protein